MKTDYKVYTTASGVNLIKNGFNSWSTNGNTQLGKLIADSKKVLKGCLVHYEVVNELTGTVNIIYKEV